MDDNYNDAEQARSSHSNYILRSLRSEPEQEIIMMLMLPFKNVWCSSNSLVLNINKNIEIVISQIDFVKHCFSELSLIKLRRWWLILPVQNPGLKGNSGTGYVLRMVWA